MKASHHCDMLRERAYDYRRGELSELDRALFEQELDQCPRCALYIERLGQMLAMAQDSPAPQWLDHDLDDERTRTMFATILTSLGQPAEPPRQELHARNQAEDDQLIPLRDLVTPSQALERLAQTTVMASEADVSLWLTHPIDAAGADSIFDAILAQLGVEGATSQTIAADEEQQPLIPLRDHTSTDQALERLAQVALLASEADASRWAARPIDAARADSLFDAILAQLGGEGVEEHAPDNLIQLKFPQLDEAIELEDHEDELDQPTQNRWTPALVILSLAAAALAVGMWLQREAQPQSPATPSQLAKSSERPNTPTNNDAPALNDHALTLALGELLPTPQDDHAKEAIKILASEGASWSITQAPKSKQYTLTLAQGTVLVEFVPGDGESLRVLAQGTEVQVVGTVFYVATAPIASQAHARVGVLAGKVRVKRELTTSAPIELTSGQELNEGDTMTQLSAAQLTHGEQLIDLKAHEHKLAMIASSSPTIDLDPRPAPTRQAPTPSKAERADTLRQKAQLAMRARDYAHAASYYEQALRFSGRSEAAIMQLELANLYVTHLDQPTRAVRHLKQFIAQNPKDIATPPTRKQLCVLLKSSAKDEPLCDQAPDLNP